MRILGARNDRKLADRLSVRPSQICKLWKRSVPVSPTLLIGIREETGLSLRQPRALMGDHRDRTGPSAKHPVLPRLQYINGAKPLQARPPDSPALLLNVAPMLSPEASGLFLRLVWLYSASEMVGRRLQRRDVTGARS